MFILFFCMISGFVRTKLVTVFWFVLLGLPANVIYSCIKSSLCCQLTGVLFVCRDPIGLLTPTQKRMPCPLGQKKGRGLESGWDSAQPKNSFLHLLFLFIYLFISPPRFYLCFLKYFSRLLLFIYCLRFLIFWLFFSLALFQFCFCTTCSLTETLPVTRWVYIQALSNCLSQLSAQEVISLCLNSTLVSHYWAYIKTFWMLVNFVLSHYQLLHQLFWVGA